MSEQNEDAVVERITQEICEAVTFTQDATPKFLQELAYEQWHKNSDTKKCVKQILGLLRPGDPLPGGGVWMPVEVTDAIAEALCTSLQYDFSQSTVARCYLAMTCAASEEKP